MSKDQFLGTNLFAIAPKGQEHGEGATRRSALRLRLLRISSAGQGKKHKMMHLRRRGSADIPLGFHQSTLRVPSAHSLPVFHVSQCAEAFRPFYRRMKVVRRRDLFRVVCQLVKCLAWDYQNPQGDMLIFCIFGKLQLPIFM